MSMLPNQSEGQSQDCTSFVTIVSFPDPFIESHSQVVLVILS